MDKISLYATSGYYFFLYFCVTSCALIFCLSILVAIFIQFHWMIFFWGCVGLGFLMIYAKEIVVLRKSPSLWFDGALVSQIDYTGKITTIDPYAPIEVTKGRQIYIKQNNQFLLLNQMAVGKKQLRYLLSEIENAGKNYNKTVHLTRLSLGI